jgi:hypothetical protein
VWQVVILSKILEKPLLAVHRQVFRWWNNLVLEERTAVPTEQLTVLGNNMRFNEGVLEHFENKNGKQCLIILDDLKNDVYSKEVCNLFTNGSHH